MLWLTTTSSKPTFRRPRFPITAWTFAPLYILKPNCQFQTVGHFVLLCDTWESHYYVLLVKLHQNSVPHLLSFIKKKAHWHSCILLCPSQLISRNVLLRNVLVLEETQIGEYRHCCHSGNTVDNQSLMLGFRTRFLKVKFSIAVNQHIHLPIHQVVLAVCKHLQKHQ